MSKRYKGFTTLAALLKFWSHEDTRILPLVIWTGLQTQIARTMTHELVPGLKALVAPLSGTVEERMMSRIIGSTRNRTVAPKLLQKVATVPGRGSS